MELLINRKELEYFLDLLDSLVINYELYADVKKEVKLSFALFDVFYYITLKEDR